MRVQGRHGDDGGSSGRRKVGREREREREMMRQGSE